MSKRLIIFLIMFLFFNATGFAFTKEMKSGEFIVLAYHAVPVKAPPYDSVRISQNLFVEQMEYLRTHGYNPVSLDDILKAGDGKGHLPQNPVLLTFDDAYISYYEFVVPLLEKFGYPSVLGVVGSFIDHPPKGLTETLMSWEQIREVASRELVEVVSHSYDLHKGIPYNPQGNIGSAVAVRAFDPEKKEYETEGDYRARIEADFKRQNKIFSRNLGFTPRAIVWPYGWYNKVSIEIAQNAGYRFCFTTVDGFARLDRLCEINRNFIINEPMEEFISIVKPKKQKSPIIRAVQVDLDLIYDPNSYEQTDKNLGKLIDRLVAMKVNTVFLQAFADPEGTGNIESVYFHNRVLPVRADIFSHAAHQMIIRDMYVYAWMPTLSIVLPDKALNEELRVIEKAGDTTRPSRSGYQRLTPFSSKVGKLLRNLYEDLAAHSQIHGILFQDDAYLTDYEDYHPLAVARYKDRFGEDFLSADLEENSELAMRWARYKTEVLIDLTKHLMKGVKKYRPVAKFARNIYAPLLTEPGSEEWFAQNYELFLQTYDQVVIMAYPQMEKVSRPSAWLEELVNKVKGFPHGIEKTVFKVQAYDWDRKSWVKDKVLLEELRDILASGGKHIAYYPDNLWVNKPMINTIKLEMSTQKYPFLP